VPAAPRLYTQTRTCSCSFGSKLTTPLVRVGVRVKVEARVRARARARAIGTASYYPLKRFKRAPRERRRDRFREGKQRLGYRAIGL